MKQRLKRLSIGFLLVLPLLLLIFFSPTQHSVCPDGTTWSFDFSGGSVSDCLGAQTHEEENGVVLEVLIRWVMSQDWTTAALSGIKVFAVFVVFVMAGSGILYSLGVLESLQTDDDPSSSEKDEAQR